MRDCAAFLRPIAHRGLHGLDTGAIENSAPAFAEAIAAGYGIECDVRQTADGEAVIFHDEMLDRLSMGRGPVAALTAAEVCALPLRVPDGGPPSSILTLRDGLALIAGRSPLLIEIKSEWCAPHPDFLPGIAAALQGYNGPVAVMSFDPDYITPFCELAPLIRRGIVSGSFSDCEDAPGVLLPDRIDRLRNCLEWGPAAPDFIAYEVAALSNPVIRFARAVARLPVFAWTVRTASDRAAAARDADAMIFEGFRP